MTLISFTRRYRDRSDNTGFQFEFLCDVCHASHMTCFQYSPMGVASSIVTAAGWIMNRGQNLGVASQQIHRLLRGREWEEAYTAAVNEAKQSFKQCNRCSGWVCPDNCFNVELKQCRLCAPNLSEEAVAMKAQAGKVQLFTNALSSDQTGGRDVSQHQVSRCPHCNARTSGGKFCTDCGKTTFVEVFCVDCGAAWTSDRNYKFCPTCGETMPEPQTLPTFGAKADSTKSAKPAGSKPASAKSQASKPGGAKPEGAGASPAFKPNSKTVEPVSKPAQTSKKTTPNAKNAKPTTITKAKKAAATTTKPVTPKKAKTAAAAKNTKPKALTKASLKASPQTKKKTVAGSKSKLSATTKKKTK